MAQTTVDRVLRNYTIIFIPANMVVSNLVGYVIVLLPNFSVSSVLQRDSLFLRAEKVSFAFLRLSDEFQICFQFKLNLTMRQSQLCNFSVNTDLYTVEPHL